MRVMTQTFKEMWDEERAPYTQVEFARKLGFTQAYVSLIDLNRRMPSKVLVNRLTSRMDKERRTEWHRAAARACGWEV